MAYPILLAGLATRELALFAAAGFLLGGLDDLLIDLIWLARSAWRSLTVYRRHARACAATIAPPQAPGRLALFVAAWQEEAVIGGMVAAALGRLRHPDWRLYIGCYPNDPKTVSAALRAAGGGRPAGADHQGGLPQLDLAGDAGRRARGRRAVSGGRTP